MWLPQIIKVEWTRLAVEFLGLSVSPGILNAEWHIPVECLAEIISKRNSHTLVIIQGDIPYVNWATDWSQRLYCACNNTCADILHARAQRTREFEALEAVYEARTFWLRDSESQLQHNNKFPHSKHKFVHFFMISNREVVVERWNTCISILLRNLRYWRIRSTMSLPCTALIDMDTHHQVMQDGVNETLREFQLTWCLVHERYCDLQLSHYVYCMHWRYTCNKQQVKRLPVIIAYFSPCFGRKTFCVLDVEPSIHLSRHIEPFFSLSFWTSVPIWIASEVLSWIEFLP